MEALLWRDYLCPWCYLGRDRTQLMERLGVRVTPLPFELHPEVPPEGRPVRPGGRLERVLELVGSECDALGIPFRKPARIANTRRALETAEVLRLKHPGAFAAFDDGCYRAHWVEGRDLGDPAVLASLVAEAGAVPQVVDEELREGLGVAALHRSMTLAREHGVASTPAWWVGDRLLIPGAQPRATIARWVGRLLERAG